MATLPVQNSGYTFYLALVSQANPQDFQVDPTIAAGDFQVSIDGGALANLINLPTVSPAGSFQVEVILASTEMTGEKTSVVAIDAAGAEWEQTLVSIDVPAGSVDSLYALEVGDHVETSVRLIINEAGTNNPLLDKEIGGSLLDPTVSITTVDSP